MTKTRGAAVKVQCGCCVCVNEIDRQKTGMQRNSEGKKYVLVEYS